MIECDIEQSPLPQTGRGVSPTHKITLKQGSETSVIWYLQESDACDAPGPAFDRATLGQLFARSRALLVGDFLYFSLGDGRDYHLQRVAVSKFTLKSLA